MLLEIGLIAAGVPAGFCFRRNECIKKFTLPALTAAVWFILFSQGLKLGGDERLAEQIGTLGLRAAFLWLMGMLFSSLCAFAVASLWLRDALAASEHERGKAERGALRGSACVLALFLGGVVLGRLSLHPGFLVHPVPVSIAFYAMLFLAGAGVGFDIGAFRIIRELKGAILLIPLGTLAGTLVGIACAWMLLGGMPLNEYLASGGACCYYSLGSPLLTRLGGPALGTVTLMANLMREVSTIVLCPFLARRFGRLAPVFCGGAAAMDSCLPVIGRICGERCAILSMFNGSVISVAVPVLLPLLMGS